MFFTATYLDGDYYADGGIFNNYPIQTYDEAPYMEKLKTNWETLGFRLDNSDEISLPTIYSTDNLSGYMSAVLWGMYDNLQKLHLNPR